MDFTHFNNKGHARMVDVGEKAETERMAIAQAMIYMQPSTLAAIQKGGIKKGDVLGVAQVAGIMAAKQTANLIPMCHPLILTAVDIEFELNEKNSSIRIQCQVKTTGKTGVEMEAINGAGVAAMTIYDMSKAIDRWMTIGEIKLLEKTGGKSGRVVRRKTPVICIASAVSNTGKTTMMEKLIQEIVRRGYKVGAVKSDCHGFEMDIPGKDSWRFTQAGAKETAVIGPNQWALLKKTEKKKGLAEVTDLMAEVDIILVEGFKQTGNPTIEVVRREKGTNIVSPAEELIAIVTDVIELSLPVPVFGLDEDVQIADFIVDRFLR